jgi:hypothetical protein
MSHAPVVFSATGTVQSYHVPNAGTYVIEATGAQGGAGDTPGGKGSRVRGMFALKAGDVLKIVAGSQGTPAAPPHHLCGGAGGSSMVWTGSSNLPAPIKLMLSARGGRGGGPSAANANAAAGSPASEADGIHVNVGAVDPSTVDALLTQWTGGTGSTRPGGSGGAGRVDHGGYNAGSFRTSTPDVQVGDGHVSIAPVPVPGAGASEKTPAPAGEPAGEAPSQTVLPLVTPRLKSWKSLLRGPRRP